MTRSRLKYLWSHYLQSSQLYGYSLEIVKFTVRYLRFYLMTTFGKTLENTGKIEKKTLGNKGLWYLEHAIINKSGWWCRDGL